MSSGLSRRKFAKREDDSSDDERTQSSLQAQPNTKAGSNANGAPRRTQQPFLTLLEEVVLIGLKDKEGYLSFWNDNISYALRGCIMIELALRGKIRMVMDPNRRRFDLPDRLIEVSDPTPTGETLLDEALKHIKSDPENLSVASWIDYLSGETWNLMKSSYHLKQVRERLSKGLVDKGVLKTEMKSFILFDMATHPIADPKPKRMLVRRILEMLTARNFVMEHDEKYFPKDVDWACLRSVVVVAACHAANVLENVLVELNFEQRDKAFMRSEELLAQYGQAPFDASFKTTSGLGGNVFAATAEESDAHGEAAVAQLEVVAAVVAIFGRMDAIL